MVPTCRDLFHTFPRGAARRRRRERAGPKSAGDWLIILRSPSLSVSMAREIATRNTCVHVYMCGYV